MQFDIQGDLAFLQAAGVLKSLLADKTTGRHILWGTDAYREQGPEYVRDQEMEIGQIVGENLGLLKTRAQKAAEQQSERTRQHAEVFTPAWICRMMNDQADMEWFGREEVFFRKDGEPTERVEFKKKSWKRYVDSKRLEITCGEAPYLVSRYEVSSGEPILLNRRVGLLDRKLRVVNENTETEADWLKWAFRAFEATYGYEFQGDNLLIARVNLMMTFGEYLKARWQRQPTLKEWKRLARAVVWNIWQMDGLTCALPYAKGHEMAEQTEFLSAFGFEPPQEKGKQPYCRIYLWRYLKASTEFRKIREGADGMKFDFIIGNPPYQEEVSENESNSSLAKQLFPYFIQESVKYANIGEILITPSRWFAGDAQDKSFLKLRDYLRNNNHIKTITYYPDERQVFPNVTIKGGVSILYYQHGYVGNVMFTTVEGEKIQTLNRPLFEDGLDVVITDPIKISVLMKIKETTTEYLTKLTKGRNAFGIIGKEEVVLSVSQEESFPGSCELRLKGDQIRYIDEEIIKKNIDVFNAYKIYISKSAGAPNTDLKVIGKSYLGQPKSACTDSLIPIGCFNNEAEAMNLQKYMSTKFLRYMVSILKVSQNVTQIVYRYVPLQDFTPSSDIDWSQSIPDIDRQLYAKYGLDENEIAFIESHVKEMV